MDKNRTSALTPAGEELSFVGQESLAFVRLSEWTFEG